MPILTRGSDIQTGIETVRFLRSTIDGLSAHIAVLDERGEILLTNQAYRNFAAQNGIEPAKVSEGANYLAVCDSAAGDHSAEATPFAQGIREVLAGKRQSFELEYPCNSPEEERWFIARVTTFGDDGPRRVVVAHENITERKLAEAAVIRAAEVGQILLNTIQTQIWYLTDDHTYGAVNKAHAEFNGLKIEDMAFKNMYDFYPKDAVEVCRLSNVEVFTTGKPVRSEEWVPHVSGKQRLISILKTPRLRADGTVEYVVCAAEDITESRRAEQALLHEKEFSEDTLDALPGVFYMFDATGRFVRWNHQFSQVTGYSDAELATMQGPDFVVGDDKRRVSETMRRVFAEGQADVEADFQTRDGRLLPYHFKGQRSSIGGQTYLLGVGIDTSEQRRAQQALETERTHLATLVNTLPNLIWLKDPDGIYLACNPEFERFFGAAERNILGKTDYDFMSGELAEIFREHDRAAMAADKPTRNEEWITYASDGHRVLLETTKMPMRTPDGRLVGVLGIGHDITASKHLEHALAIREGQLRATLEVNPSVAVQWYDEEARVIYWNPASTLMFGWRAEEAMGKTLDQLIYTDEEAANFRNLLEQIKSEGKPFGLYEAPVRRSDGRDCWALSSTFAIPAEQGKTIFVCMDVDITARKQAEAELIRHRDDLERLVAERTEALAAAKDAAEAANIAKSAFLANMSHELRTPMNGVLGMIEIAKRRMADAKGLDQLDKAKRSAERLLGVINDILDLSKIEAERMVLEEVPVQLAEVVSNLTGVLGHKAAEKGLRLATDLPADLQYLPLKGDPLRLGQILFNLVGNAIKFTQQGEISLRVRQVDDSSHLSPALPPLPSPLPRGEREPKPDDSSPLSPRGRGAGGEGAPDATVLLRFEISDTGIGIDGEAQSRLFQSFEQADNSMTRKYGGTGLGLAISKRLVRLMNGDIGVDSTPGQGSTFWFVVPLKKREQEADAPIPTFSILTAEQRLQIEYAGTRVLLAEDEPIAQEVSRCLLEDAGLVVDIAEDGQQALELARKNRYALILMDMQMPVLNGIDATQAIRSDSLNRDTPILAMTANAFDEDRQVCLDADMNEHIAKPVDPERLYETLLIWLEKAK